jgi:hypothetical protein
MSQAQPARTEANIEQVAAMKADPTREHRWLQKLVGDWTYEIDAPTSSNGPSTKVTGTERVRPLGDVWVLAEGRGEMPGGGPEATLMTIGFDPGTKRFVGTWIGSMMTHLWVYRGDLDANEHVLTLNSEGPSMSGDGSMSQYRDVIEFKSHDHRLLTASVLDRHGTWQPFMTMRYRRTTPRA